MSEKRRLLWMVGLPTCVLLVLTVARLIGGVEPDLALGTCGGQMTWLHATDSADRLNQAVRHGFCGVEVNVQFHPDGYFVVDYSLPNPSAPRLESFMTSVAKERFFWWLDFKNLTAANADAATAELRRLGEKVGRHIVIVESHDIAGLWRLGVNGRNVFKAYWATKGGTILRRPFDHLRIMLSLILIDPPIVTMPENVVGGLEDYYLGRRRRMAFTVNDEERIRALFSKGIDVVLTDSLALRF